MNAPSKARGTASGQPETPVEKFKAVWRVMPEEEQAYWRKQFLSSHKQAHIREEIRDRYGIWLPADNKLNVVRSWIRDNDWRLAQAAEMRENEARIMAEHPDWTLEQVRGEVLRHSFFKTLATGDFALGLRTVAQDVNVRRLSLEEGKVLEAKKAEQAKALEFCLEAAKKFPRVKKLFMQAFGALKRATDKHRRAPAARHGPTPLRITHGGRRPPSAVPRRRTGRSAATPP